MIIYFDTLMKEIFTDKIKWNGMISRNGSNVRISKEDCI